MYKYIYSSTFGNYHLVFFSVVYVINNCSLSTGNYSYYYYYYKQLITRGKSQPCRRIRGAV